MSIRHLPHIYVSCVGSAVCCLEQSNVESRVLPVESRVLPVESRVLPVESRVLPVKSCVLPVPWYHNPPVGTNK